MVIEVKYRYRYNCRKRDDVEKRKSRIEPQGAPVNPRVRQRRKSQYEIVRELPSGWRMSAVWRPGRVPL